MPLLVLVCSPRMLRASLLAYTGGAVFYLGLFDWIRLVPGYTALHHALLAVYLGSFFAVFGLCVSLVCRRFGATVALCAAPFAWVALEYARSNMGFLALPWGLLGHSQYQNHLFLQIASICGTFGISFLIVMVNTSIAALVMSIFHRHPHTMAFRHEHISKRTAGLLVVLSASLLLATVGLGHKVLSAKIQGKPLRIALIQGNISLAAKQDPKQAAAIMNTYEALSLEAARNQPDLIVWPENATPRSIAMDGALFTRIKWIAKESDAALLIGSSQSQKFNVKHSDRSRFYNSAFLISPTDDGQSPQRYDKLRLFPFGEYLPHPKTIPWEMIGITAVKPFIAGREFTLFNTNETTFAVTICWENLLPDLVRKFVNKGAKFIINLTNEAWFGEDAAPEQFLSMSVLRAVENGVYIARCANTGISCIIDSCGRVLDRVRDKQGKDVFVRGVLTGEVVPLSSNTLYTRYGDWFPWLCVFASVGVILASALSRKSKHIIPR